jgi:signal transduction histidine kinase
MAGSSPLGSYRLTRNFAIGALVVMATVAAVSVQFDRQLATRQLQETAERHSAALSRTAADIPWRRFAYFVHSAERLEAGKIRSYWQTEDLARDIRDLLAGTEVLKVRLHDARGRTVFSTEEAEIGGDDSGDPGLRTAFAGETASRLAFVEHIGSLGGSVTQRWVLSSYVPLRSPVGAGDMTGVVEIHSDVSELQSYLARAEAKETGLIAAGFAIAFVLLLAMVWHAERRIHRQHEESLDRAAETVRIESAERPNLELVGHLSHEIRTPLNTILGFAETIKEGLFGPVGNDRYVEYSSDIYESGQHLLKIINDTLDLANLESGQLTANYEPVDLVETARDAFDSLGQQAATAGVALRLKAPRDIGRIVSDATRVRQALLNLLSNALKFTPPGGSVTVRMEQAAPAGTIRVSVTDTGVGMKSDEIPIALTPFSQIDLSISNKGRGSGLGLPLSRRLVELLGGNLELDSEIGIGTTVTFTLPDHADARSVLPEATAA